MDEGGRKQMTFVLKEGLIHIVGNHGLPNNNIEGTVDATEVSGFYLEYSINKKPYKPLDKKIIIEKEDLNQTNIQIIVRASKDKNVIYYKSDIIPLTHSILFGKKLEDSYPEALKFLLKEQENIRLEMQRLKHQIGLEVQQTDRQLKGTMKEIVETFEEINKKGSLF
jgi:hypothetical protein